MLGRNHAALGVAAFAGAAWAGGHVVGLPAMTAYQAGFGVAVAAGAALAPDLDEAHSLGGHANPVSLLAIFGGHRRRTHCLLAVAAVAALAVVCASDRLAAAIVVGFAACTGGAVLSRRLSGGGALLCVPFGIAVGDAAFRWVPGGWWLVAAVAFPYASHLVGDGLTPGGLPLFLPFSQRKVSLHLFRTGHAVEHLVVTPVVGLLALASLYAAFSSTAAGFAHDMLAALR